MREEQIRARLNNYITNNGITAKFIANQLDIHESTLSRFRKNRIELYSEQLDAIELYLNKKDPDH